MKKLLALVLALLFCSVPALSDGEELLPEYDAYREMAAGHDLSGLRFGFLFPGEEYEYPSRIRAEAVAAFCREMGIDVSNVCVRYGVTLENMYESAASLAQAGCSVIFAEGADAEPEFLRAAADYPAATFCHHGGDIARESGLSNAYNFGFSEHEARYVAGVVAGVRMQEMIKDKEIRTDRPVYVGYVAPAPCPEVTSAATAFYLGVRSMLPNADVRLKLAYAGEDATDARNYSVALMLMRDYGYQVGVIAAHEFTTGVAVLSDSMYVYSVGYGMDLTRFSAKAHIQSVCVNRGIYYAYAAACAASGAEIAPDWCGGFAENAVSVTPINEASFTWGTRYPEANQAMRRTVEAIAAGELQVFALSAFTVNGEPLAASDYILEGEGGPYFAEGVFRSRPAFDFIIDGVEIEETSF